MDENDRGQFFIVAAPSGGGKTSLVKALVGDMDHIVVSISHTTRKKRPMEVDGVDYFFVDEPAFMSLVNDGAFLEHARVFGHLYGTSEGQITDRLQAGIDVVLDIDWQGAEQIRRAFPDAISIFVVPPSLAELKKRLMDRQQDKEEIIAERMQRARDELIHYPEFDYLIVNDAFETAAMALKSIVTSHRLTMARQSKRQRKLLSFLLQTQ